jgi:hypothetical protein
MLRPTLLPKRRYLELHNTTSIRTDPTDNRDYLAVIPGFPWLLGDF